jgi:glycosyltransferase involved in cell wall biosynthesis
MQKASREQFVILLLHTVSLHSLPLVKSLAARTKRLLVFTSAPFVDRDAAEYTSRENFQIIHQRMFSIRTSRRHPQGYADPMDIHIPYSIFFDLMVRRPDAVVSLEFGIRTLQALAYRMCRPSTRLIIWAPLSERTELGRGRIREGLRRIILRKTDGVIVNGNSGFRYVRRLGTDLRKIHIIPHLTDTGRFQSIPPTRAASAARRLLYVGQLIERKGLLPFLQGLVDWLTLHPETQAEFTIAGEGPIRRQLEEATVPKNLSLTFPGSIPYQHLPSYYAQAGIFVFPTLGDEWGLVVNEAMAAGLPVLGSIHSQAVEELVEDGKNGWRFTPDDPQSVSGALDDIFRISSADLEAMRRNARETAVQLDPETIGGEFAAAIGG